jgi:hypothetical protein
MGFAHFSHLTRLGKIILATGFKLTWNFNGHMNTNTLFNIKNIGQNIPALSRGLEPVRRQCSVADTLLPMVFILQIMVIIGISIAQMHNGDRCTLVF